MWNREAIVQVEAQLLPHYAECAIFCLVQDAFEMFEKIRFLLWWNHPDLLLTINSRKFRVYPDLFLTLFLLLFSLWLPHLISQPF